MKLRDLAGLLYALDLIGDNISLGAALNAWDRICEDSLLVPRCDCVRFDCVADLRCALCERNAYLALARRLDAALGDLDVETIIEAAMLRLDRVAKVGDANLLLDLASGWPPPRSEPEASR